MHLREKDISLRYFFHNYPGYQHTFTSHQIFTGQADSNIRGKLIPKLTAMYTGVSTPEWTGR